METLEGKYPHLFKEVLWEWGPIRARFIALQSAPAEKISNVNIVPRINGHWVVLQHKNGEWDIPGGTLEPGEIYTETIERELLEEAGARLIFFQIVGAWHCHSLAEKTHRPHLPFPEFYRLVGTGEIDIIQSPTNPSNAEQIIKVARVDLQTAIDNFLSCGRDDLAELYQYVNDMEYK